MKWVETQPPPIFDDVCSPPKVLVPVEPQFASIGGVISERMGMVDWDGGFDLMVS